MYLKFAFINHDFKLLRLSKIKFKIEAVDLILNNYAIITILLQVIPLIFNEMI